MSLEGCTSLDEALARIAGAVRGPDTVIRGYGWRSGDWASGEEPTSARLDAITGDTPAAMIAKDYHSLWLNSAALALAGGDLEVEGGVVERDETGSPTGVLREEAAWRFKERHLVVPDEAYLAAMQVGVKLAASRGVTSVHDKDGWLGALRLWQRLEERGSLTLRVWQSVPAANVGALGELGIRSGFGSPLLRLGYLKAFMDGTLGSKTALMLDGSGRHDHERRGARRDHPGGCSRGASRLPCTRSATAPIATRSTRSSGRARRGSRLGCVTASSMPSC